MTPFRNDDSNPFNRQSVWPRMPQTAIRPGWLPKAAPLPAPPEPASDPQPEFDIPVAEPPAPEAAPFSAAIGKPRPRPTRRDLRLTPLVAAAAVGAGGMAALVLLIGSRAPSAPPAPATQAPAALAVGNLVSATDEGPAPTLASASAPAAPAAAPVAEARPPVARLAAAAATYAPTIRVPAVAAQPFSTDLQLPPPRPVASLAGPAEPPITPPPAAPAYVPPPPPDRDAPIPSHVPD